MAKQRLGVIKEVTLGNNCPECFNQNLKLTFFQKHLYNWLYDRTTKEISNQVQCQKCKEIIYPVAWTDDIERSFDYYRKTIVPLRPKFVLTKGFYLLLTGVLLVLGAAFSFYKGWLHF